MTDDADNEMHSQYGRPAEPRNLEQPPKRTRLAILEDIRERVGTFPSETGVYLFKDTEGRVLYVGKAKNLRSRVSSYFLPSANLLESRGPEIERMVQTLVEDVEYIPCDSEVDALLREARLIKDIQPRFNARQKDDKSFPYLMITTGEDFPGVYITRQPRTKGVKLFGPFTSPADLRNALPLLQKVFKFRTCNLEIDEGDTNRQHFRPCILYNIKQCTGPCGARVDKKEYRRNIANLIRFLNSRHGDLMRQLERRMQQASKTMDFEKAAELRDQIKALQGLSKRGLVEDNLQPEVFTATVVDKREGVQRLTEVLGLSAPPRSIEGVDIAHLAGQQTVGSVVTFIDGTPFKGGYRRFKIISHDRNDDFASIKEVVWRRYKHAGMQEELFPDIILIDGGKGQLSSAFAAFEGLDFRPPVLISLAKKEEEIFVHGRDEPIRLKRNDAALRLLQSVRDEAHRFAQAYHHILRRNDMLGDRRLHGKPERRSRQKDDDTPDVELTPPIE